MLPLAVDARQAEYNPDAGRFLSELAATLKSKNDYIQIIEALKTYMDAVSSELSRPAARLELSLPVLPSEHVG